MSLPICWWVWCGEPLGAKQNDIILIKQDRKSIEKIIDKDLDLILADKIFQSQRGKLQILAGWAANVTLTNWQKEESRQLTEQRGIINYLFFNFKIGFFERNLGRLIKKFGILRKKYRHNWETVTTIVQITMSLMNIKQIQELTEEVVQKEYKKSIVNIMEGCTEWLTEKKIPLLSEVKILMNIVILRFI
jgi:hypothetical protein